ncbi:MAG TPA: carbamoyl phosphate synthase large subunit, partial [Pseudonocardiaceae bacterium]|nr:carbamoyl phosphate synthase large subunit [Pseudonocardiaceae bacterium]
LADLGFEVLATRGTANTLRRNGIPCTEVRKHFEGPAPADGLPGQDNIIDLINAGQVDMIINTPYGNPGPRVDGYEIRTAAVSRSIPCITTVQGAAAAVQGIEALIRDEIAVRPLQALHTALRFPPGAGIAG